MSKLKKRRHKVYFTAKCKETDDGGGVQILNF